MAIQRVGPRPAALVHQAAAGFTLDGTQPSANTPAFNANGNLVFPEEVAADGGGLFEFGQDRVVAVSRVHIEIPSSDVAGWSLFVTDGVLDVLIASTTAVAASYTLAQVPVVLMRGESLKLVVVGASAGIVKATVTASTVDNAADLPSPAATPAGLGLVIGVDVQAWSAFLDSVDQNLGTADSPSFAGLNVAGDLIVGGGTILANAEQIDARANHIYLNADYTTAVAQVGGLVVNYLPTATVDATTGAGVVTAGVNGVSDPTVTTDGAATFAANDLVMISGSDNDGENDGLFEVVGHAANVMTLRSTGNGVTNRVEAFTIDQLTANAGDTGMTITKVNLSVVRAGTDGDWETAKGSTTPLVFSDLLTDSSAVQPNRGNELYVDQVNGDDANPTHVGYATIGAAMAAAVAGDTVIGPSGAHTESFSVPAGVKLRAPGLRLTVDTSPGILLADGASIRIDDLIVGDGKIGILVAAASAKAHARVETMTVGSVAGAAAYGAGNTSASGVLVINCDRIYVGNGSYGCGDASTSVGHIDVHVLNIYGLAGAGGGFGLGAFGGRLTGYVGHFADAGGSLTAINAAGGEVDILVTEVRTTGGVVTSGAGFVLLKTSRLECTNGFVSTGTGISYVSADDVDCTAAYNVGAGTTLNLLCQTLAGTETEAGTANVFVSSQFPSKAQDVWEMQRAQSPGNDTYRARRSNQDETVLAVHAMASVIGASAGGTYVLDVRKNSTTAADGTSVLTGTLDLEGLVANTWSAATVKSNGDEELSAGDDLRAWLSSDNGDLAGFTDGVNVCISIGPR